MIPAHPRNTRRESKEILSAPIVTILTEREKTMWISASSVTYDGSLPKREWLAIRKQAALAIDPKSAEVAWIYGLSFDCYGVNPDLPEELEVVGREYFARSLGSEIWVSFNDLPEATSEMLWQMHSRRLAFPAGFAAARAALLGDDAEDLFQRAVN